MEIPLLSRRILIQYLAVIVLRRRLPGYLLQGGFTPTDRA
jgi:hypothetical protein